MIVSFVCARCAHAYRSHSMGRPTALELTSALSAGKFVKTSELVHPFSAIRAAPAPAAAPLDHSDG